MIAAAAAVAGLGVASAPAQAATPVSAWCASHVHATVSPSYAVLYKDGRAITVKIDAPTLPAISSASVTLRDPAGIGHVVTSVQRVDGNTFQAKGVIAASAKPGSWTVEAKVNYTRTGDNVTISGTCNAQTGLQVRKATYLSQPAVRRNGSTVTVTGKWYGLNTAGTQYVAAAGHGVKIQFKAYHPAAHTWGPWTNVGSVSSSNGGVIKFVDHHADSPGDYRTSYAGNAWFSGVATSNASYIGGS